ncbi:MAG: hypothetical protein GY788_01180 [bacterium]|nr:hypothetical protein [bacterium]
MRCYITELTNIHLRYQEDNERRYDEMLECFKVDQENNLEKLKSAIDSVKQVDIKIFGLQMSRSSVEDVKKVDEKIFAFQVSRENLIDIQNEIEENILTDSQFNDYDFEEEAQEWIDNIK